MPSGLPLDLVAFVEVDGAPRVTFETGIKETEGPRARRPWGMSSLRLLVDLAGADQPAVRPHRDAQRIGRFLHFHSSTTSGSACLIRARIQDSVSPRQSPKSLIFASISRDGDSPLGWPIFFKLLEILQWVLCLATKITPLSVGEFFFYSGFVSFDVD